MHYPVPGQEAERLATLEDLRILDTPPDPGFDHLVTIASAYFGVPIALVSLIDRDRQWFKARVGLDPCQTPREQAFCAHAICQPDEVMVVEDARADPRFADNPLVLGDPLIRFYAGAPIVAHNGMALGTLCIIDRQPRHLSLADRSVLREFAASAASLIELHLRNRLLARAAQVDPLTGLLNRRGLELELQAAFAGVAEGECCGLIFGDLDHFKLINDRHGHDVGDRVLRDVAQHLRGIVRASDCVARIGGDEFVILLSHPIEDEHLAAIAERVARPFVLPSLPQHPPITLSVGGALAPRDGIDAETLRHRADAALYAAKRAGRRRFAVASGLSAEALDPAPEISVP